MYLVAILPPSNIRRALLDIQTSFFRGGTDPAPLSLPPHVPLAYYDSPPEEPQSMVQLHAFETRGAFADPPWIVMKLRPIEELMRVKKQLPVGTAADWSPTAIGIPVARSEEAPTTGTDDLPSLRWKTSHLVCLELCTLDPLHWWEHLEYSERWRVKLRRLMQ